VVWVGEDHDREVGGFDPFSGDAIVCQFLEALAFLYENEPPVLAVPFTAGELSRLEDFQLEVGGDRPRAEFTDILFGLNALIHVNQILTSNSWLA